jgi:hypothetical protein
VADFQTYAYVQAVIIQPLGEDGVLIAASNTIRGYTSRDKVNFRILPLLQNHCHTPSSYNQYLLSHGSKLVSLMKWVPEYVQAWIAMIGEKLDTTLRDWALSSSSSSSSSNVIATNPLA